MAVNGPDLGGDDTEAVAREVKRQLDEVRSMFVQCVYKRYPDD